MKQVIFTIALFTMACLSAEAQYGLFIGLEAGYGRHTVKFSESYQDQFVQLTGVSYNTYRRSGIGGGIRLGYNFSPNFGLFIAPAAHQKGTSYETAENGEFEFTDKNGNPFTAVGYVKWKEQYTAVNIPLLLRAGLPLGERFSLVFTSGPSVNVMVKGKGEAVIETQDKTIPVDDYEIRFGKNRTDDYNNLDFSVVFAPGMAFNLDDEGRFRLFAEARFDLGLKDMYTQKRKDFLEAGGIDILGTRKVRSTVFTLGFEYSLKGWD